MSKIDDLATRYERHIRVPWQRTIAGPQRVLMVVYDKEQERAFRARKEEFAHRTRTAGHEWVEFDCTRCFAAWMAGQEYREAYFEDPTLMGDGAAGEFLENVAADLGEVLDAVDGQTVVGVIGVGCLYGFTRASDLLKAVDPCIRGRLVLFFPGTKDGNNYRLLDARDGWDYLANCITHHSPGGDS